MTKKFRLLTMAAMLLLPLAACDEGTTTTPSVTGTVSGTVTVDGTGAAGLTVTLNSGKSATTSATGTYSITDVPGGTYIVTVSGFGADVTFGGQTSQAAVIATAGQVVPLNFTGSRIRTSVIAGSVTSGAAGLTGVTVTMTGPETRTATTDTNGQFIAGGLRAGTYTVAISGQPNTVTCAATSQSVTVAAGESKVASFTCTANSTARVSGVLFVDENNKNDVFDGAALEDNLAAANILITLTGPTVGTTRTAQSTAAGTYEFTGLPAGQYTVTIDAADPDIPAGYVYGGTSPTSAPVTVAAGASVTYNFPFDITTQTIRAYAFLGDDARTLPVGAPVRNVFIELYPTEADAIALTNRLGRDTTDASGEVQITFPRSADRSPGSATIADQIVYAQITVPATDIPAGLTLNGEQRFEIRYNTKLRNDLAKDTFDMLNGNVTLKSDAFSINNTALSGWQVELFTDTTAAAVQTVLTNAAGRASFTNIVAAPPVNYFVRLTPVPAAQPGAASLAPGGNPHAFTTTNAPERGANVGTFIRFTHNGLVSNTDTADVGDHRVRFNDADVFVRVFHETNDTLRWQIAGDDGGFAGLPTMMIGLRYDSAGTIVNRTEQVPVAAGNFFANVPTGLSSYIAWSRTTVPCTTNPCPAGTQKSLEEDTIFNVGVTGGPGSALAAGGTGQANVCPLSTLQTQAGCGSFMYKFEDGSITGTVMSPTWGYAGAPAPVGVGSMRVRIRSEAATIQPRPTDTTVTTNAGGTYALAGVREGRYIVSILHDSVTTAGDSVWASLGAVSTGTVDVQGPGNAAAGPAFVMYRMDTQIQGVVVNDRDQDTNTVDPLEGLASTIQVYRDGVGAITLDSLVCTTTSSAATGAYSCGKLREGVYAVKVTQQVGSVTLRKFSGTGTVVDTAIVHTTAQPTASTTNVDYVARVGNTAPIPLPLWNYATNQPSAGTNPSHFTFLYSTGTVTGTVTAAGTPIPGMSMTLNRCQTETAAPPFTPTAGNCLTYFPGFQPITLATDATGKFTFTGLQEGVYEVTPSPASGNPPQASTTPTRQLYMLLGNNDVETGNFVAP